MLIFALSGPSALRPCANVRSHTARLTKRTKTELVNMFSNLAHLEAYHFPALTRPTASQKCTQPAYM
jgi:hypothetical protein